MGSSKRYNLKICFRKVEFMKNKMVNKILFVAVLTMFFATLASAANTLCLQWEVPQDDKTPDFDISLVKGRERVLYPPNEITLKVGGVVVAVHEKNMEQVEECITIIDKKALSSYMLGIHHYGGDATSLRFLELYEKEKGGTIKVIDNYVSNFKNNTDGDASATPRSNSKFWVLLPVSEVLAKLEQPQPVKVVKEKPKEEPKIKPCDPVKGADLTHCDFTGKDFSKADFRNTNIQGVSFKNARLREALFNDANCQKADFSHADLYDASFSHANCEGANFNKADLQKVNFKDADLKKAKFRKADIRKANFKKTDLRKSNIDQAKRNEGANFENTRR